LSFACLTAPVVTKSSIILSSNKTQNGDILVPANPGVPGKWPLKQVYNKAPLCKLFLHLPRATIIREIRIAACLVRVEKIQAGCPSCRPTNSVKALKGKYHTTWTCLPQTHLGGLPTLTLTTNSSWLPCGRFAMPLISPLMPWLAVWCSGNALVSINAVALHRARLVLGWVTAFRQVNCLIT